METSRNILWTGGYDSTFRVLYSIIVDKVEVVPHYLIDTNRRSTLRELYAIDEIREKLNCGNKLKEINYKNIKDVKIDQGLTEAYLYLKNIYKIGIQYDWLSRYAKHYLDDPLEISIHGDGKFKKMLGPYLYKNKEDDSWRIKSVDTKIPECILFENFQFPIYGMEKKTMKAIAINHGFDKMLEMTWFCHIPYRGVYPCGSCNPCKDAYRMGFKYRLPFRAKVNYIIKNYILGKK